MASVRRPGGVTTARVRWRRRVGRACGGGGSCSGGRAGAVPEREACRWTERRGGGGKSRRSAYVVDLFGGVGIWILKKNL